MQNRNFGATALENSSGAQLWEKRRGTALSRSFGGNFGQLSRPADSFRQQQLLGKAFRSFRSTALENSFGHNFVEKRRRTALGAALGGALRSSFAGSFEKFQALGSTLVNATLGEKHWGATLGSSFRESLCRIALGNKFEA